MNMKQYYTAEEVRSILGFGDVDSILKRIRRGELPATKPFGNRYGYRILPQDLKNYLQSRGIEIELPDPGTLSVA